MTDPANDNTPVDIGDVIGEGPAALLDWLDRTFDQLIVDENEKTD